MVNDDLSKRFNRPTQPDVPASLPSRVGRVSEIVKSMFVWELRHYFGESPDNTQIVPYVDKFATDLPSADRDLDPLETVVRIIRQYPDLTERLPYIGVALTAGKSNKIALSTKFVDSVQVTPRLIAGAVPGTPPDQVVWTTTPAPTDFDDNNQPGLPADWPEPVGGAIYCLDDGDWVEFTTSFDGVEHVSKIVFDRVRLGRSPQTSRTIADIINLQALYCHADVVFVNDNPTLIVEPGGPLGQGSALSIQRTGASQNFDDFIRFVSNVKVGPSDEFPAANRYLNSINMTVSLVVGTEGDTVRTELTDLLIEFFTMVLDDRQYTLWGRSFSSDVPDEFYQILILDKEVALAGEQEVPRPDDPKRKIFINRLNVPVTMMLYTDRAIQAGIAVEEDDSLPGMN